MANDDKMWKKNFLKIFKHFPDFLPKSRKEREREKKREKFEEIDQNL